MVITFADTNNLLNINCMTIDNLDPKCVWKNFYALTQIPRPSKKEWRAVDFMENFGKSLGLETIRDEVGNIIIRKPATPGMASSMTGRTTPWRPISTVNG